jgi:hypothetical protein
VCAVIGQGGSIIRSKNVAAVSHPSTGVYCIKPTDTVVNVRRVVPSVTVDWGPSSGSDLLAFYTENTGACPNNRIEVLTYDLQQNRTDRVAFTLVVD